MFSHSDAETNSVRLLVWTREQFCPESTSELEHWCGRTDRTRQSIPRGCSCWLERPFTVANKVEQSHSCREQLIRTGNCHWMKTVQPFLDRPKFHLARLDTTRHVRLCRASRDERLQPCCSNMADDEQAIARLCKFRRLYAFAYTDPICPVK